MKSVLEGIRVIDFGRYIAGPYCAALLGDLGADVIRVERLDGGEDRYVVPVTDDGVGAMFMQCNRNKRTEELETVALRHQLSLYERARPRRCPDRCPDRCNHGFRCGLS